MNVTFRRVLHPHHGVFCAHACFGKLMTRHIRFLRDFNIPEPVSGGLVVAGHHLHAASDHGTGAERGQSAVGRSCWCSSRPSA